MGTATVEVDKNLKDQLISGAYSDIRVLTVADFGEGGLYLLKVESSLLPEGYNYQQELVIGSNGHYFRPWRDT
jgi:hypothetical protein